jgi:hypothetical protein
MEIPVPMYLENTGSSGSRRRLELALALVAVQVWLSLLSMLDWRHGAARRLILWGLLAGLMLLRLWPRPTPASLDADPFPRWLRNLLVAALIVDFGIAGNTIFESWMTDRIPLDQGQATWRAARLFWRGAKSLWSRGAG